MSTPLTSTPLSEPLTLPCGAVLPNRIAKAAMTEGLADPSDQPTTAHQVLYQRWSEGGAGLLISGNVMVDRRYLERAGNVVLEDDSGLERLSAWAKAGTRAGNHLWMQINHPGRQCPRMVNMHPVSPSEVQLKLAGNFARPRALNEAEIHQIIERFATTASLAKAAGFTGVQIHSAHGYLGSQFLSPVTNQRSDQWGGSLANRARFLLATIDAVRDRVGGDFPVSVKLNSADFQKGGFSLEDCVQVAQWVGEHGVDLLEISGGTYEQLVFMSSGSRDQADQAQPAVRESTRKREAYFLEYAEAIRSAARIPLMITGGFRSRHAMEEALQEGNCAVIGLARPFCVDAEIARKLISGALAWCPKQEDELYLGEGWLSPASRSRTIQAVNNQGQAGWYYHQIIRLSQGLPPEMDLGVFQAFCRHMTGDFRRALARKSAAAKA